jgi:uncharacterized FlaG/YvyC family protein
MASDVPFKPSVTQVAPANRSPIAAIAHRASGNSLPAGGASAALAATQTAPPAKSSEELDKLLAQLNKHLHDSGRPTQFRLDSSSGRNLIQEINPDSGEVVGEIPANEFKALAQGLGFSGLLLDTRA